LINARLSRENDDDAIVRSSDSPLSESKLHFSVDLLYIVLCDKSKSVYATNAQQVVRKSTKKSKADNRCASCHVKMMLYIWCSLLSLLLNKAVHNKSK